MYSFCCKKKNIDAADVKNKMVIQKDLKTNKKKFRRTLTILIIGPGDSGKSTFVKQIKYLYYSEPGTQELEKFISVLKLNCLDSMQSIVLSSRVQLPEELLIHKDAVIRSSELEFCVDDIIVLWDHPVVKDAFARRNELYIQIPSTSNYFFNNARRFASNDFQPSIDDIMRAKLKTTGINQIEVEYKGTSIVLVDVGGQRSERRKWFHQFDTVNAAIFLAALDEYDMVLEEDHNTNRLTESLILWKEMTGMPHFRPPSWILFLNKWDLFKEKIKEYPLNKYFPDITQEEASDAKKSFEFIQKLFEKDYKGKRSISSLYCHRTCALDKTKIDKVFKSVRDTLLCEDLSEIGICSL